MDTAALAATIDDAFTAGTHDSPEVRAAVATAFDALDAGTVRVAEKVDGEWVVHGWLKRAILLGFRQLDMATIEVGPYEYHDKVPLKTGYAEAGVRVVPPAVVRYGAHVERGAVLMPSYVNIGARVGAETMVDTWATVGSCAQIGRGVHLSGGVGIGGVLEPPNARPVIIEDGAFIGSRVVVTEGCIVEEGAVLGTGVVLTGSVQVIDVTGDEPVVHKGRVPARAIVVPGTRQRSFPAGDYGVSCGLIIGYRSGDTDDKLSLEDALRTHDVAV